MKDTHFIPPDAVKHRVVKRSPDAFDAEAFVPFKIVETPWAGGGACSTAMDMAIFGQMFLNHGTYGHARILSPASVAEMTRNQIPGISAWHEDLYFPEASYGLGWSTRDRKNSVGYAETLQSQKAFSHGGAGGVLVWVDPGYEIVGLYFSVASHGGIPPSAPLPGGFGELAGRADLLINAVTAAVVD